MKTDRKLPTTIENERLVEYLGLEFELCYLRGPGDAVWILADKIRRKDKIALEMLRIFNRFIRIGKALDRVNAVRPNASTESTDDSPTGKGSSGGSSNNAPYARCIGVRVRVKDHVASLHIRPGIEPRLLLDAPTLKGPTLLDPSFQVALDDPILDVLTAEPRGDAGGDRPRTRRKRLPPAGDGES